MSRRSIALFIPPLMTASLWLCTRARAQSRRQDPMQGAVNLVQALSQNLERLGDTYALIILGSVLVVWLIVLLSTKGETRTRAARVGAGVTGVAFAGLLALGGMSLIWKLTIAMAIGFGSWWLAALVVPSAAMWTPDEEDLERERERERWGEDRERW